jgi:hypothetical protein
MRLARLEIPRSAYLTRDCLGSILGKVKAGTLVQDHEGLMNSVNEYLIVSTDITDCLILEGPFEGNWIYIRKAYLKHLSPLELLAEQSE